MERARAGDRAAFAALYRRHRAAAVWVASRWTASDHNAEDAVAEGFTRLLAALPRLDVVGDGFRHYLLACVRNAARDQRRRTGRVEVTDAVPVPTTTGAADDSIVVCVERRLLAEAMAALPPRWRRVLWFTEVEGVTPAELAAGMGTTPNAVAAIAYRARKRLRAAYSDQPPAAA